MVAAIPSIIASVRYCRRLHLPSARGDDLLHHRNEAFLFDFAEPAERLMMRRTSRSLDPAEQPFSGFGQAADLRPAIPAIHHPLDKLAGLQALKSAGGGRAIEHHLRRERGL